MSENDDFSSFDEYNTNSNDNIFLFLKSKGTYQNKRRKNKSSMWYSVIVFVKSTMGIVIFVMPNYFNQSGILLSSIVYLLFLLNIYFCNTLINRIVERKKNNQILDLDSLEALALHLTKNNIFNHIFYFVIKV